jgi:hypothetical protein
MASIVITPWRYFHMLFYVTCGAGGACLRFYCNSAVVKPRVLKPCGFWEGAISVSFKALHALPWIESLLQVILSWPFTAKRANLPPLLPKVWAFIGLSNWIKLNIPSREIKYRGESIRESEHDCGDGNSPTWARMLGQIWSSARDVRDREGTSVRRIINHLLARVRICIDCKVK